MTTFPGVPDIPIVNNPKPILWLPLLVAFCVLLFVGGVSAAEVVGRVVSIQDGDTLTALVSQKQMRVRLVDLRRGGGEMAKKVGRLGKAVWKPGPSHQD